MSEINYEQYSVHPAAAIFPMMEGSELEELASDVKARGLGDPIELYRGQIIDGRNRLAACKIAGVKPTYREHEDADESQPFDVTALVISKNLHRRHLTASQRSAIAASLLGLEQTAAKDRQRMGRATLPDPGDAGRARDKVAELLRVSGRSVAKAAQAKRDGIPELVEMMNRGEISVSAAADASTAPAHKQRMAVNCGKAGVMHLAKQQRRRKRRVKNRPASRPPSPSQSSKLSQPRIPVYEHDEEPELDDDFRLSLRWFENDCTDRRRILACASQAVNALTEALQKCGLAGDLGEQIRDIETAIDVALAAERCAGGNARW